MDFITAQDFTGKVYNIPNAMIESPNGGSVENVQLTDFITEKVDDMLHKLLGGSLYNAFLAGLTALPAAWVGTNAPGYAIDDEVFYGDHVWKSLAINNLNNVPAEGADWTQVADNEWLLLKNGLSYYSYATQWRWGTTTKDRMWKGVKTMLVPHIFTEWLKADYDDYTKVGIVRRTAENATVIDPTRRIARAHNVFVQQVVGDNGLYVYLCYAQSLGSYSGSYDTAVYPTFVEYLRKNVVIPGTENFLNI